MVKDEICSQDGLDMMTSKLFSCHFWGSPCSKLANSGVVARQVGFMSYMSSIRRYDGLQSRFKPLKGLYLYGFAELPAILPVLEKSKRPSKKGRVSQLAPFVSSLKKKFIV